MIVRLQPVDDRSQVWSLSGEDGTFSLTDDREAQPPAAVEVLDPLLAVVHQALSSVRRIAVEPAAGRSPAQVRSPLSHDRRGATADSSR